MLTHVVCFRFASLDIAQEAADRLLSMKGRIEALKGIEAGVDQTRSGRSYDLALITRHDDQAGLDAYGAHPVHQEVLAWLKPRIEAVVAVDFSS
jgi:hypothetical protein